MKESGITYRILSMSLSHNRLKVRSRPESTLEMNVRPLRGVPALGKPKTRYQPANQFLGLVEQGKLCRLSGWAPRRRNLKVATSTVCATTSPFDLLPRPEPIPSVPAALEYF